MVCACSWTSVSSKHSVSPVLLPVGDDGKAIRVVSVTADIRVPSCHSCRRRVILQSRKRHEGHMWSTCFSLRVMLEGSVFLLGVLKGVTHARASGDAFPAVWDVSLVRVVGIAQQGASRRGPAAPWGAGFTELDFFLCAVLRCGGLTPLWMSHSRRDILTDCRKRQRKKETLISGSHSKVLYVFFLSQMIWTTFWNSSEADSQWQRKWLSAQRGIFKQWVRSQ